MNLGILIDFLLGHRGSVKSVIQGFLPGIVLKLFLIVLPMILMAMSKIEGFIALSALEARSAGKFHLFLLVNVFLGSIIAGTALEQLKEFLNQSPSEYVVITLFVPRLQVQTRAVNMLRT